MASPHSPDHSSKKPKLGISVDIPRFRYHNLPVNGLWTHLTASGLIGSPEQFHSLQSAASSSDKELQPADIERALGNAASKALSIVDVRTSDCDGGHVPSAINFPFISFEQAVGSLVAFYAKIMSAYPAAAQQAVSSETDDETPAPGGHRLVFYCMYGKEQSPACAQSFLTKFAQEFPALRPPNVYVLSGGFTAWINRFVELPESKDAIKKGADFDNGVAGFESDKWVLAKENEDIGERIVYRRDAVRWQQSALSLSRASSQEQVASQ